MSEELGLEELQAELHDNQNTIIQVYYDVLNERAEKLADYFRNTAPVRTGALKGSVVKTTVEVSEKRIKFKVEFVGYNESGEPYQTIANTLNRGFCYRRGNRITFSTGTHFIDDGVKTILSGIDQEINERIQNLIGG